MGEILSSAEAKRLAQEAYFDGRVMRRAGSYSIYRLRSQRPMLGNFVLILFDTGHDFPADNVPDGLIIPVDIDGRRGYLLEESVAERYKP